MTNPWFRLHAEFATDPKVQMMSEAYQRRFIMLLCMRCSSGDVTLHETEIAFQLRIDVTEWMETKAVFLEKNLIDNDNKILSWDKRQYVSDSSAERVAKHRANKKQASNVTVTPPYTDTDTDTEHKKIKTKPTRVDFYDVPQNVIDDFTAHRKTKRAKITQTAIDQILLESKKAGISLSDALTLCCSRGWVGFNAGWILRESVKPRDAPQFKTSAEKSADWMSKLRGSEVQKIIDLN